MSVNLGINLSLLLPRGGDSDMSTAVCRRQVLMQDVHNANANNACPLANQNCCELVQIKTNKPQWL